MKIYKSLNTVIEFNFDSNIQNNQRKENIKVFNQKFNNIFKRTMFTKLSNIRNLKKSGDLLTDTGNDSTIKAVVNTTASSKLNSLDFANNQIKQQQYIIEQTSSSTTTISIKDIYTGINNPMQFNRNLATYGKINKKYIVESKDDKLKTDILFIKFKAKRLEAADSAFHNEKISKDQFLVYVKRMNVLDLSYVHSTITDIIEEGYYKENEKEEYVKIIYHVITTKPTLVDYGGPNKFKPIHLYSNRKSGTYFIIL